MKKRILALLLTLCMVLSLLPHTAHAADGNDAAVPQAEAQAEANATEAKAGEDVVALAFTSDVHNGTQLNGSGETNLSAIRMQNWLSIVQPKYNNAIQVMGFCGDMAAASSNSTTFWTFTQTVMDVVTDNGMTGVYAVGNHEYMNGDFATTHNAAVQGKYILNAEGRAVDGEKYVMYCLGTNSSHGTSWAYDDSQITSLTNYLNGVGNDKVIIILTHFPLHNYGSHRTSNTLPVLNAINNAAVGPDGQYGTSDDKKIVFLWGHNHSEGDNNYDQVWLPKDKINDDSNSTVYFYYAAAGSMADKEYGSSAKVLGKGLVMTINSKNQLSFTYYDASGNNVTEPDNQTITEQDPEPITGATVPGTTETGTSGTVNLTNPVKVGRSVQLSVSVEPSNSSYDVNWTSQTPEIATVDNTGKVTGVSEGTATITVNIIDKLQRASQMLNILVTVTAGAAGNAFELTNTLEPGKEYIIASVNSGTGYALTNNNGSVSATAIEVEDETIYPDDPENLVFTADGSTSVTDLVNNGRYLAITSSGSSGWGGSSYSLTLNTSAQNRAWTYSSNRLSTTRSGGSSQYYVYYSSSNGFTCSSSTSGTSSRNVYLYAKVEGPTVAVTGVTVTPATAMIEARKTVQLTATVAPDNASNKKVSWSSSNTAVATVDNNGKVRGVGEGTATITATTVDGGKTASAAITVTPSTATEQHYVIFSNGYALSTDRSPNTANGGSSSYTYTGLAGVAYTSGDAADDNIRWIIEETTGGYYIMSLDGRYLNATYTSGSNSGQGNLKLDDTADVWVLDSGYTLENGTVDGSKLKSTNATNSSTSDKYLTFESSGTLFTVRSSSNAGTISIEEASDPIAVTGVSVAPTTATIEVRKTVQLTATVSPADATNKNVTWSSSDTTVATVDENGKVKGVKEGTATITVTTLDGGKTASAVITVTPSTSTETHYVILINGYALSTDRSPNTANGGSSYTYTGLAGVAYTSGTTADDNIRWIIEETTGGYYIKSLDDKYLNATYTSGSNSGQGDLKLDNTSDLWVLDSGYSLENGTVDGSKLKSTNASNSSTSDKYLAYEDNANLFTVRSSGNADTITIEEASDPVAASGVSLDKHELNLSAGQNGTLTATVTPSNASNKRVNWTSSQASVAAVDDNGVVTALAEGTAIITVTTVDGGFTDTCTVTVTPAKTITYVQADALEADQEYLIVNGNTGNVYLVSNEPNGSKKLKAVAASVVDGVITITEDVAAKTTFTAEIRTSTSGTVSAWLKNDGQYLYIDSTDGLRMAAASVQTGSSNSGKFWHYKADGKNLLWFFKDQSSNDGYSDTSSTYRYYLTLSGTDFTDDHVGSGTSLANTTTPAIYLFVKTDHIHNWEGPTWNWTGDVEKRAAVGATATFTCSECNETKVIDAEVQQSTEGERTKYTASVTFNGTTYTDVMYEKLPLAPGTIEITADKTEVLAGDLVTLTITLGPITDLASMQMEVVLPEGLAFVSAEEDSEVDSKLGFNLDFCNNDTLVINGYTNRVAYTSDSNLVLGTIVCSVSDGFASGTVTLDDLEFFTLDPEEIPVTVTDVTITKVETYTITYDLAGGALPEGKTNPETYTKLTDAFTLNNPEKEGYTFAGWTGTDLTEAAVTVTVAKGSTGNRSYTATWTPVEYTITYNLNGGTNAAANPAVYTIETPTITLADPTREGFIFGGWYDNSDFSGTAVTQIAQGSTGSVTLYAKWTVKTWTITFVNDDNTVLHTQEVEHGTVPVYDGPTPTKQGTAAYSYVFTGWDPELAAATADATYKAKFTQTVNTYTVTWVNWNGDVLEIDENVEYGERPTYNGAQPTRPSTAEYVYTFDGWTPNITNVTADVTYTAKFTEAPNLHKISGSITSFTITAEGKTYGEGDITVELFEFGASEVLASATVSGTEMTYELTGVRAGIYTLKVSKVDHAAQTYRVTVVEDDVEQDVKIHLLGDVNGDGKVTTIDFALTNWYATGVKTPDNYQFSCADVNENGDVTTADVGLVNSHAKKISILWETLKTAQP